MLSAYDSKRKLERAVKVDLEGWEGKIAIRACNVFLARNMEGQKILDQLYTRYE